MKQLYKTIPRKRRTLASQCLLAGRNDFHAEFDYTDRYSAGVLDNPLSLQQNRKNVLDKIPEMLFELSVQLLVQLPVLYSICEFCLT